MSTRTWFMLGLDGNPDRFDFPLTCLLLVARYFLLAAAVVVVVVVVVVACCW